MYPNDFQGPKSHEKLYSCHMFYHQRVVDIPDGKPKWNGLNDASDLIEDSPPELKKRKREEDEKAKQEDGEGNKK